MFVILLLEGLNAILFSVFFYVNHLVEYDFQFRM